MYRFWQVLVTTTSKNSYVDFNKSMKQLREGLRMRTDWLTDKARQWMDWDGQFVRDYGDHSGFNDHNVDDLWSLEWSNRSHWQCLDDYQGDFDDHHDGSDDHQHGPDDKVCALRPLVPALETGEGRSGQKTFFFCKLQINLLVNRMQKICQYIHYLFYYTENHSSVFITGISHPRISEQNMVLGRSLSLQNLETREPSGW